jgi:hypothetical protein
MAPNPAAALAERRGRRRGGLVVRAVLCCGVLAAWGPDVPGFLGLSGSRRSWSPRPSRSVALGAEGDVAVAPEGDVTVADDQSALESPTPEKEPVYADADAGGAPEPNLPVFQELNISGKTTPKGLMRAMVGAFNKGERAVDLVLTDPRCKHVFLYSVALLPSAFRASGQVLIRRRDRRLRMRVVQKFRPQEDEEPEVFRVASGTNVTALGQLVKNIFTDPLGNNLKRTVQLEFQGKACAGLAILVVEHAERLAFRELFFHARYVQEEIPSSEPASDQDAQAAPAAPNKKVSILVTITTG